MPLTPIPDEEVREMKQLTAFLEDLERRGVRVLTLTLPKRCRIWWGTNYGSHCDYGGIPVKFR